MTFNKLTQILILREFSLLTKEDRVGQDVEGGAHLRSAFAYFVLPPRNRYRRTQEEYGKEVW